MARSTFDGPVLVGDNRFGPLRNVGYTDLVQSTTIVLTNTTNGTAGYSGGSGVFVSSNNIPNNVGTIWTAQNGAYSSSGPTIGTAPTADTSGTIYRGVVFYLPYSSNISDIIIDVGTLPTDGTVTANSIQAYASNNFATSTGVYGTFAAITSATSASASYPGSQLPNSSYTLQDVQNLQPGNQPTWFSQLVVTLKITNTGLTTPTSGQIGVTVRYAQNDMNIGNGTTYPYGNFD